MLTKGYHHQEACDMLGLSYAADLLGPAGLTPSELRQWKKVHTNDPTNPLPQDDGTTIPYPVAPVWPHGWEPGLPSDSASPWERSVIIATAFEGQLEKLLGKLLRDREDPDPQSRSAKLARHYALSFLGANNVIVVYHAGIDAYAIAFAGTQNGLGALQDVTFLPVPAEDLSFLGWESKTTYLYNPSGKPMVPASMHLGFRLAVEQFTTQAASANSLIEVLIGLNKGNRGKDEQGRLRLMITGHSLGAAMASVFTAWLQANATQPQFREKEYPGFPELDLKMYVFAAPKTGNAGFVQSFNLGLTNQGRAFHIANTLDSVPEVPLTIQTPYSLSNMDMLLGLVQEPSSSQKLLGDVGPVVSLSTEREEDKSGNIIKRVTDRVAEVAKKGALNTLKWIYGVDWDIHRVVDYNYGHLGSPIVIRGEYPLSAEEVKVPAHFFPGDSLAKETEFIPDENLLRRWWQHWPWVYRKALDESM